MTYETENIVNRGDVPKGYVVKRHELRGYDSPDRWWSAATERGRSLGDHGSYEEARDACVVEWKVQKKKRRKRRRK